MASSPPHHYIRLKEHLPAPAVAASPAPRTSSLLRAAKAVAVVALLVGVLIFCHCCALTFTGVSLSKEWIDAAPWSWWAANKLGTNIDEKQRVANENALRGALYRLNKLGPALREELHVATGSKEYRSVQQKFATCAVVGESTSLYTGPRLYADEIDAHDLVIRLPPVESLSFYRDRQARIRGSKSSLEVHYEGNKTNWLAAPGVHGLCGAHANTPILLMADDYANATTNARLRDGCASNVANLNRTLTVSNSTAETLLAVQDALNRAVTFQGSVLNFTEEWLATYAALALCDKVDLYGVIMEPTTYGYDPSEMPETESAVADNDKPKVQHPVHWAAALAKLGVRDVAFDALMLTMREPRGRDQLPEQALDYVRAQVEAGKAMLLERHNGTAALPTANKSCIVMGASSDLYGQGRGAWVDSHDSVWRCNQHIPDRTDGAVTADHGARTDVVVTLRLNLVNPDVSSKLKTAITDNADAKAYVYPARGRGDAPLNASEVILKEGSEYEFITPQLQQTVYDFIGSIAPTTQVDGWAFHSTGHFAVNMALLSCDRAAAAGFGLGRLTLFHHLFLLEAAMLELYRQAGLMDVFMPEDVRSRLQVYLRNMYQSGVLRIPRSEETIHSKVM